MVTSPALTDIRTVLSRAMTARDDIVSRSYWGNVVRDELSWVDSRAQRWYRLGEPIDLSEDEMPEWYAHGATGIHSASDPEGDADKVAALDLVIEALWQWRDKRKRRNR